MLFDKKKLIKNALIFTAVSTAAASTYTLSIKYAKKLLYRHHKDDLFPCLLETKYNAKHIYIKNINDIKMHGLMIEKDNANTTVCILHPFGLSSIDMQLYVPYFEEHLPDSNILLVDASAHGQSDGYIRGFGIKDIQDLVSWNQYLLNQYGESHKILMYGKEQGANIILNAAGSHLLKNVKAIILDGAYTSPYDIIGYRLQEDYKISRFPAVKIVSEYIKKHTRVDITETSMKYARHNDIPTLFFHTKNDELVPLKMVYPLYNKNRGEKVLFVIKDEKYLYELNESDEYRQTMSDFINKQMK